MAQDAKGKQGLEGSTLPDFLVVVTTVHMELFGYRCGRSACGKEFFTAQPLENATAPCPHCMKVSKVPTDG